MDIQARKVELVVAVAFGAIIAWLCHRAIDAEARLAVLESDRKAIDRHIAELERAARPAPARRPAPSESELAERRAAYVAEARRAWIERTGGEPSAEVLANMREQAERIFPDGR